jgi:putative membrane protein
MGFVVQLVVNAAALWVATRLVPGVSYQGGPLPFLVVGVINTTLRPITKLLTCPLILLTLGLFALVVNGLMLWLTSTLAAQFGINFHVAGFFPAFWGALVVSIVSTVLSMVVRDDTPYRSR